MINADQSERWVSESILAVLMRENLTAAPRNPCIQDDNDSSSSNLSQIPSDTSASIASPTKIFASYITKL